MNSQGSAEKGRMGGSGGLDGNTRRPRCENRTGPSGSTAAIFGRCRQERLQ
jgi:hypothetical protein